MALPTYEEPQKQNEEYELLFSEAVSGIAVHQLIRSEDGRPHDYRFLRVNKAFEKLTGLKAADVLGKTVRQVLPDIEDFWIEIYGGVVDTGQAAAFEQYNKSLDRHYEVNAYRLNGERFVATFNDVTKARRSMKALRENEGFLMAIFDAAQDGISVQDRELNIVMTNRWLANLFPKDAPLIGKKCYQVYHGYSNPCEQCPSVKAMLTGEKQSKIEPYPNRQNPKKWFHVTACPIKKNDEITGVLEIVTDITDRKSAEDRLREQNLFLHNVLESLPYPFLVINADDYRIEMANSKVGGQEAWENSTCHEITHGKEIPCDCADHCCPLHEIKESGRPCIVEHTHYDKDGRPCSFEVHGYPVFDRDGKLSKMIEYSIDITKRKKAERERERLIAELREALDQVKQLSGLIPICMYCKNIRNDQGYWDQVEQFITKNSSAKLSHGICPDCLAKKHPGVE